MQRRKMIPHMVAIVLIVLTSLAAWAAPKAQVIYTFKGEKYGDGNLPLSGVIGDSNGNLYGVTADGGTGCGVDYCGTVFQLSPGTGGWTESVLHNFTHDGVDGFNPLTGGKWSKTILWKFNSNGPTRPTWGWIMGANGSFYGTAGGGPHCNNGPCGTVYELTP